MFRHKYHCTNHSYPNLYGCDLISFIKYTATNYDFLSVQYTKVVGSIIKRLKALFSRNHW